MINALEYGILGGLGFDCTPLLNKLIKSLDRDKEIYFPAGSYYFNSKLDVISNNIVIKGCGINNTTFIRNYNEPNINESLIKTTSTIIISNLAILSAAKCNGGSAIRLEGLQASSSILRDLYISAQSTGSWAIPVVLLGTESLGIRTCFLDNLEIFAATSHLFWIINGHGITLNNVNCYPAGGSVNYGTIQNYNSYRSGNIDIRSRYLERLYLYGVDNLIITSIPNTDIQKSGCNNIKAY